MDKEARGKALRAIGLLVHSNSEPTGQRDRQANGTTVARVEPVRRSARLAILLVRIFDSQPLVYCNHLLRRCVGSVASVRGMDCHVEENSGRHGGARYSLEGVVSDTDSAGVPPRETVFDESGTRPAGYKDKTSGERGTTDCERIQLAQTIERTMPVASLIGRNKISPGYVYPTTGKARIYVEATLPVDVYVVGRSQVSAFNSPEEAARLGILSYIGTTKIDNQIITLPPAWQSTEWNIVIGNPHTETVAVYYAVLDQ